MNPRSGKHEVVTKEGLKRGLRELGLKEGDIVGVHSSLSSFGYVDGGADTVIDALLEVVGEEGTIVMPTHSSNLEEVGLSPEEKAAGISWLYKILPYDPMQSFYPFTGRKYRISVILPSRSFLGFKTASTSSPTQIFSGSISPSL